jgi:hypothetical protein
VLDNVESPYAVMDVLSPLISGARQKKTIERQSQYLHVNPGMAGAAFGAPAPTAPPPAAPPQTDMVEQLRRLGELRDAGILTEGEFAAQKAKAEPLTIRRALQARPSAASPGRPTAARGRSGGRRSPQPSTVPT